MGPLLTVKEIRKATQERLELWLPAYLKEVGRRHEVELRPPKSWHRLPDFRALKVDQSPSCVVTSPGLAQPFERDEDGTYFGWWSVNVFIVVRGKSYDETADSVGLYTGAIRATLTQQGIPIEHARKPRCTGEGYDELARDSSRTIGAGVASFVLPVGNVMNDLAGPIILPEAPDYVFPEDPIIEEALVEVDRME